MAKEFSVVKLAVFNIFSDLFLISFAFYRCLHILGRVPCCYMYTIEELSLELHSVSTLVSLMCSPVFCL